MPDVFFPLSSIPPLFAGTFRAKSQPNKNRVNLDPRLAHKCLGQFGLLGTPIFGIRVPKPPERQHLEPQLEKTYRIGPGNVQDILGVCLTTKT
jgi:hypothetical protein